MFSMLLAMRGSVALICWVRFPWRAWNRCMNSCVGGRSFSVSELYALQVVGTQVYLVADVAELVGPAVTVLDSWVQ